MAAQTIKAQVEELIGSTSIASLDDWCGDAVNKLIILLPYDSLFPFTTLEEVTYSGVYTEIAVKNKRIFEVNRAPSLTSSLYRICTLITPEEFEGQYSDTTSMYYPTDFDPKYTIAEDTVDFAIEVSIAGNIEANSADIVWSTNRMAYGVLRYGTSSDDLSTVVQVPGYAMIQLVELTNLLLEQDYFYEITATSHTGETDTESGSFTTTSSIRLENDGITNLLVTELKTRQLLDFVLDSGMSNEIVNTTEPDADIYAQTEMATSTHDIVELNFTNSTHASDFDVATN